MNAVEKIVKVFCFDKYCSFFPWLLKPSKSLGQMLSYISNATDHDQSISLVGKCIKLKRTAHWDCFPRSFSKQRSIKRLSECSLNLSKLDSSSKIYWWSLIKSKWTKTYWARAQICALRCAQNEQNQNSTIKTYYFWK